MNQDERKHRWSASRDQLSAGKEALRARRFLPSLTALADEEALVTEVNRAGKIEGIVLRYTFSTVPGQVQRSWFQQQGEAAT
jgi:hypothetical protein